MAFCSNCGKQLGEQEQFCSACGTAAASQAAQPQRVQQPVYQQPVQQPTRDPVQLLMTLSQRTNTNGIIWLVIGILQILGGIFWDWWLLIVGVLNVISSIQDMQYSKKVLSDPSGVVKKFEPLVGPIITLVYNLVVGGVIGVVGSIYYFVAIRNFVMENRMAFDAMDTTAVTQPSQQPPMQ
ncbi:MAG: zinc ribbon domain-containing protein [Clostridia bacterium]|nr:zinc ribbon domain-containing protein [Clostridia bacterium]